MQKLKYIKNKFYKALDQHFHKEEIGAFFYLLSEKFYGITRINLAMQPNEEIKDETLILDALELLKQHKPIQYILGATEFYDLQFKVNENVLIPRPETEELVSWILDEVKQKKTYNILDIGTGSGCIAITLAKHLVNTTVYALDVSKDALEVAKENAKHNEVSITYVEDDILNIEACNASLKGVEFDVIVSNPPYVRAIEKQLMQPNVLQHEPHLALFVEDDNALVFYKAIAKFATQFLAPNGQLFFEINEYLGQETVNLLKHCGFRNIELRQDIFEKDRMIKAEIN